MAMKWGAWRGAAVYAALLSAAFLVGGLAAEIYGGELDNYAYDVMLRHYRPQPWPHQSAILAIDEYTLQSLPRGIESLRPSLTQALRIVAAAHPKTVAIDITLADHRDPETDASLAAALRQTPNLVLATDLLNDSWEDPLPEFVAAANSHLGQVHAAPDNNDEITRAIALEKVFKFKRRYALALEAYWLSIGAPNIVLSPESLQLGSETVPVPSRNITSIGGVQTGDGRLMRIRFVPPNMKPIPRVSLAKLIADPSLAQAFTGRAVFAGVTAITEVRDRLTTPVGSRRTTGIEINAEAFETIANRLFITDVDRGWVWLFSLVLAAAIGLAFRRLPGWWAYVGGLAAVLAAGAAPYCFFTHSLVFSLATPLTVAVLSFLCAGAYYHLVVRRNWRAELAARERYQQAMHFVTHEMRTPLSAIQGSSELISRFPLTEEKRKQIALLINSESKRLARMVEIFLNVERLSAGQMELKREPIDVAGMLEQCIARAGPLAERKQISVGLTPVPENLRIAGDRELMEYACYNLLTNAVKYSPRRTAVSVSAWRENTQVHIAVEDQGIGMDQKEVRQIFQKFYRTKRAEESGEAGSGIGLSIVQQIVEQHGGEIGVTSKPGVGSRFTVAMPLSAEAPVPAVPERH
jgi:signal transduction histidine kinase